MSIAIELERVLILDAASEQFIQLRERPSGATDARSSTAPRRVFSIKIGTPEAIAIERRLRGLPVPRPQTHDLLATAIQALGAKVKSVEIHTLEEGTFFADIHLVREGEDEVITLDARPSDAIALAVGLMVPLFATESVLEAASEAEAQVEPPAFDPEDDEDD